MPHPVAGVSVATHAFLGQLALGHDKYNRHPSSGRCRCLHMEEAVKALKTS